MSKRLSRWVRSFDPYRLDALHPQPGIAPMVLETARVKHLLARILLLAFGVFLLWAVLAPIDSGVHVSGSVVVEGNRKAVQHPQGGVVQSIRVQEGSRVQAGQVLMTINPLGLQAQLNAVDLDLIDALVTESRLLAERTQRERIEWLSALKVYQPQEKAQEAMRLQQSLLRSRRQEIEARERIIKQEIAGHEARLRELEQVMFLRKGQLITLTEEARNVRQLANEGFVPRSQANQLERSRGDLVAGISSLSSEMADVRSQIQEAQLRITQERSTYLKEVDAELSAAQKSRRALEVQVESARFNLSLADIKAPVAGTVVGLAVFTEGGVIQGGQTLMEIVPDHHALIVHARVPPEQIDTVRVGLPADLRFTAFNAVTTPVIPGQVQLVGADKRLKGPNDDAAAPPEYYLAHVRPTPEGERLLAQYQVQAGMTVDVIVKTGERTFMSYLIKPFFDIFAISFKN